MIATYGGNVDAAPHVHHAIQIICPSRNANCILNEKSIAGLAVIDSMVKHRLQLSQGWVFLIEPKSQFGRHVKAHLSNKKVQEFPDVNCDDIQTLSKAKSLLMRLFATQSEPLLGFEQRVFDHRVQRVLAELTNEFSTQYELTLAWKARDVAQRLGMSESRFLHLFTKELGLAWRPYLLWQRILCAVKWLQKGHSATEAAHWSGFSDSAHLSRTFRRHFGMSIRQALAIFKPS